MTIIDLMTNDTTEVESEVAGLVYRFLADGTLIEEDQVSAYVVNGNTLILDFGEELGDERYQTMTAEDNSTRDHLHLSVVMGSLKGILHWTRVE